MKGKFDKRKNLNLLKINQYFLDKYVYKPLPLWRRFLRAYKTINSLFLFIGSETKKLLAV